MSNNAAFLAAHPGYMQEYYLAHEGRMRSRIIPGAERQSKLCKQCNTIKSRNEFTIRKTGPRIGHLAAYCKICSIAVNKVAMERDPSIYRRIQRPSKLKCYYGITIEDYNRMLAKQGGGCALCGATNPLVGNRTYLRNGKKTKRTVFDVDHNHKTGKVRGLLCTRCNRLVGLANDKIETAKKLVKYLRKAG